MHNPTTAATILLVPGSLRAASVNRAVLRTAARLAGDAIDATVYEPVSALPPFNPDDDPEAGPAPAAVAELRRWLAGTDAVLFCVPEYAGTMPGAFKNLLDWAVGGGELYGKPVAEAIRHQIAAVVRALAGHASAARTSNGFRPAT